MNLQVRSPPARLETLRKLHTSSSAMRILDYPIEGETMSSRWSDVFTRYPSGIFFSFHFGLSLLKLTIRKRGTFIIMGVTGELS